MADPSPPDFAIELNDLRDGWNAAMGLRFVRATSDEVIVEWEVADQHRQPYGIVHGGVHSGVIETIASVGAAIHARPRGQAVVGLENHTSFIRAVRSGVVRATARPLTRGRRSQAWEVSLVDDAGALVATGRVRLLVLEPEASVGGAEIGSKQA